MSLLNETREIQDRLGNYCKTGKLEEIPGLTSGRVQHYRRLVYNVVKNTMNQAYPITRSALDSTIWEEMVNTFFSEHTTHSPQVWKLPLEFYEYHYSVDTAKHLNLPYLNDLLYFEWLEIKIHTMPDGKIPALKVDGDLLTDPLVLNPDHQILRLEYPVHKVAVQSLEREKGEYYLLIFREPDSGNVRFLDLSVLHSFILMRIHESNDPIQEFKGDIAKLAGIESELFLNDYLKTFISDLKNLQMVMGFKA